jgi:hypothetical protein
MVGTGGKWVEVQNRALQALLANLYPECLLTDVRAARHTELAHDFSHGDQPEEE